MLSYHQTTYDTIEANIAAGNSRVARLDLLMPRTYAPSMCDTSEDQLGIQLPKSVREWYAQPRALELLHHGFRMGHNPLYPDEFRLEHAALINGDPVTALVLIEEEIGCCLWGVAVDGSDDPKALARWDGDTDDFSWRICAPTFSDFLTILIGGSRPLYPNYFDDP